MTYAIALSAAAQEMPVPIDLQHNLFCKILSYDRTLTAEARDNIVIGIMYQSRYITSLNTVKQFSEAIEKTSGETISGKLVKYVHIDIMDKDISEAVEEHNPDVLYVAPLRAVNIKDIAEVCRTREILSMTGVPEYCQQGISVGLGEMEGRPRIIINLAASRAEGANFSSLLLKLATIIGEKTE